MASPTRAQPAASTIGPGLRPAGLVSLCRLSGRQAPCLPRSRSAGSRRYCPAARVQLAPRNRLQDRDAGPADVAGIPRSLRPPWLFMQCALASMRLWRGRGRPVIAHDDCTRLLFLAAMSLTDRIRSSFRPRIPVLAVSSGLGWPCSASGSMVAFSSLMFMTPVRPVLSEV